MSAGAAERRKGQPLYLYAIVASGPHGQDAPASTDTIVDGLSTIVAGPYSAVVGGGPGPDLKGRSREDLGHLLIAHQKVIEQLMRTAPVLPVKFGTCMPDEKGIRELLERGRPLLDSTFAELKGCTQLEVSVTWDVEAVFADIAGEEAVARLKAQIADNGQAATTAQRLALGRLVKAALERRRAAMATQISHALRAGRCDRQSRRSRPRRLAPRPSSQDRRSGRSRPLSRDARRRVRRPIVLSLRRTDAARKLRHARNRAPRKRRDGACRPHIGRRADGEPR
jgi:Gas vesicle synthesis protein GvpL/GvpF